MCFNCPDMIDDCWEEGCYKPDGGKYSKSSKFYAGDKYCEHLKKKYGHDVALMADRYGFD